MSNLPLALERLIEAEDAGQERVEKPAPARAIKVKPEDEPPHPVLMLARKVLRRWDIELVATGEHRWIQTTGARKRIWLILPRESGEAAFEEIE